MFFYKEGEEQDPGYEVPEPIPAPTVSLLNDTNDFSYNTVSLGGVMENSIQTLNGDNTIRVITRHQIINETNWNSDTIITFNQPAEVRSVLVYEIPGEFTAGYTHHYDIDVAVLFYKDGSGNWVESFFPGGGSGPVYINGAMRYNGAFDNIASPYLFELPTPTVATEWMIRLHSRNVSGQVGLYGTFSI
jgi:hypothetical protein